MSESKFASLHTGSGKSVLGLHYFRKSAVNYFGIAEHRHGQDNPYFRAKITYATSGSTNDTFVLDMDNDIEFKEFIDQMLVPEPVSAEELGKIRDRLRDTAKDEPDSVPRDTLELSDGVTGLYHWLQDIEHHVTTPPENWEFSMNSRIRDYDPVVYTCTHRFNHGTSFKVMLRIDVYDCQYAGVMDIRPINSIAFDNETYNRFLGQFVYDVIRPYAESAGISYSYSREIPVIPTAKDAPQESNEEPASVTRDCLEISGEAEEFFNWLHSRFYNGEQVGVWSFKAAQGTQEEEYIVCRKPNTVTSPADVHIAFRDHFTYAKVCGIVVCDHYTPDTPGFNLILHEFVRDIVRPYAEKHEITYSYTGTPGEQSPKSDGTAKESTGNPGTLDSFVIPDNAKGFHDSLLTKARHPELGDTWSVIQRGTRVDCRCNDTTEDFTVTISFTIDSSFAKVTDIQSDGKEINVDQYNHYLNRFVDEIVKPFAETQPFRYDHY